MAMTTVSPGKCVVWLIMLDSFTVQGGDGKVTIVFKYDRELNLVYKVHPVRNEKTLTLR